MLLFFLSYIFFALWPFFCLFVFLLYYLRPLKQTLFIALNEDVCVLAFGFFYVRNVVVAVVVIEVVLSFREIIDALQKIMGLCFNLVFFSFLSAPLVVLWRKFLAFNYFLRLPPTNRPLKNLFGHLHSSYTCWNATLAFTIGM